MTCDVLVAQLDSALASEAKGCRFEPCRGRFFLFVCFFCSLCCRSLRISQGKDLLRRDRERTTGPGYPNGVNSPVLPFFLENLLSKSGVEVSRTVLLSRFLQELSRSNNLGCLG